MKTDWRFPAFAIALAAFALVLAAPAHADAQRARFECHYSTVKQVGYDPVVTIVTQPDIERFLGAKSECVYRTSYARSATPEAMAADTRTQPGSGVEENYENLEYESGPTGNEAVQAVSDECTELVDLNYEFLDNALTFERDYGGRTLQICANYVAFSRQGGITVTDPASAEYGHKGRVQCMPSSGDVLRRAERMKPGTGLLIAGRIDIDDQSQAYVIRNCRILSVR